jgi:hypothetical protein
MLQQPAMKNYTYGPKSSLSFQQNYKQAANNKLVKVVRLLIILNIWLGV